MLHPETLFEWKELLRCNVDSDPEVMYFDDVKNTENLTSQNNHQPTDSIDNGECKLAFCLMCLRGSLISSRF